MSELTEMYIFTIQPIESPCLSICLWTFISVVGLVRTTRRCPRCSSAAVHLEEMLAVVLGSGRARERENGKSTWRLALRPKGT